jgi:hypothetical protein
LLEPLKFQENQVIHSTTNVSRRAKNKTKVLRGGKKQNKTKVLPSSKKQNKTKVLRGGKKQNKIKMLPRSNFPSFPSDFQNTLTTGQDRSIVN